MAGILPASNYREFVEKVRAANNIKDVVGRYVTLGDDNTAVCPFHKETRPSFSLNLPHQYFHCFGCKASGDVFKFVELMEGKGFGQTVELLAQWAGLPVYHPQAKDLEAQEAETATLYVTEAVARYYRAALTVDAAAYFTGRRRLPEEFLERFMVGWADGRAVSYVQQTLGSTWLDAMEAAGLATALRNQMTWATTSASHRDLFYERLVLPNIRRAAPVFLTGRALDDREPKYLHQRGREAPLYNEDALGPEVFITEGPFDALSLAAWDYSAVALNGSLRPGAVSKLHRVQRAYLVLDNDRAGFQATMVLAAALWPRGRVVRLPLGEDPSDFYCRRTRGEFEALVATAMDPGNYAIEQVDVRTPRERLSDALKPLFEFLALAKPMAQEAYLEKMVARFTLGAEWKKRARQELDVMARGTTRCPACGTVWTTRR